MKTLLLCLLSLLLALLYAPVKVAAQGDAAPPPLTELLLAEKTVYYFVDAECNGCALGQELPEGKYWVVSRGLGQAPYELHHTLLAKFEAQLHTRFETPTGLLDAQVFRFHFTAAEAEAFRQQQIERKRREGYRIIEIDLEQ